MNPKDDKSQGQANGDDDLIAKVKAAQAQDGQTAALQQQIKELTAQVASLTEMAGRAQAELQNAKIRLEREAADARKYASESVLISLLSTIDNFQRAFKHLPDDLKTHEWVKGIGAVEQDLMKRVGEMGLKRFDAVGQKADTSRHEVLMTGPGEEGMVTEMFEDGYELHGKILRPAKVKVGDGTKAA